MWDCNQSKNKNTSSAFNETIKKQYNSDLDDLIIKVNQMKLSKSVIESKKSFFEARLAFKKLEPILPSYKPSLYRSLNQPNLITVHEDNNAFKNELPHGFQVLEELLWGENIDQKQVKIEIQLLSNALKLDKANVDFSYFKEYHFLWAVRQQLLRVVSLGISGFDSPIAKHSIPETKAVFESMKNYFVLNEKLFKNAEIHKKWIDLLEKNIVYLSVNKDFNAFDRYNYIKNNIHPFLPIWIATVKDWEVSFPFETELKYDATTFFSDKTFNLDYFSPVYSRNLSKELKPLGKTLFNDPTLSRNSIFSCASCHQEKKYFTDGLIKSASNSGGTLSRNTPTLLYSGLQKAQFYDARADFIENQIMEVANNPKEFHTNAETMVKNIKKNKSYIKQFELQFKDGLTPRNLTVAIASYVRSLQPFNSKFDRNINQQENTLTSDEINGFNIFMGKAKCGTCHFAPIFNGTSPPEYLHNDLEVIGVPVKPQLSKAKIDEDKGRFLIFDAPWRKHAFKTSNVRNIEKTAPYFHNGAYKTLEEVIEFYNQGGGNGIGLSLENQSLPNEKLLLTKKEKQDIVLFLKTLTDKY
ncbi:MAG: methylamine utilization protein [Pseudarcicella sp.]|nr:methylamine utilization protein [Pseudarcicella sp.]